MAANPPKLSIKFDPSNASWDNHHIKLIGGTDETTTAVGALTRIQVDVSNVSTQTVSDVQVEAYVCDPTTSTTPFNKVADTGRFFATSVGVIAGGNHQVITLKPESTSTGGWTAATTASDATGLFWKPSAAQANHHCIMAHTWLGDGSEGNALGPSDPFDIINNPHDGQRNINVVPVPAGGAGIRFDFIADDPDPRHDPDVILAMHERRGTQAFSPSVRQILSTGPFARLHSVPSRFKTLSFGLDGRAVESGMAKLEEDARTARLRFHDPKQRAPLTMVATFNPKEKPGTFHTFDVVQTTRAGRIQGGLRLVALLVP